MDKEWTAKESVRALADAEARLADDAAGIDELRGVCRLLVRILRESAERDASWVEQAARP